MSRLRRSTWGIVAFVTLACGGKTEVRNEEPDGGGWGGSTQGTGGSTPVAGAAGRGGSLGRGGTAGASGSAGRGGSAGVAGAAGRGGVAGIGGTPPGGTGGVTPGGTGGAAGGSPEQVIDAICRRLEASGCGYTNCRQNLKQTMDTYELWGCGGEWLEGQSCRLRDPVPCGGSNFCDAAYAIYQKCIDDAEICVRGNPPQGGCVMACEQGWAVECKPNAGALTCVCTSGRFSGRQFAVPAECQSEEWLKAIRASCE